MFTFFLSVGLLIDLNYVLRNFWLVVLALLVVALGKTLLNLAILRAFRQPGDVAFPPRCSSRPSGIFVCAGGGGGVCGRDNAGRAKTGDGGDCIVVVSQPAMVYRCAARAQAGLARHYRADALFRGSYRRELFVLRVWRRRATMVVVSASVCA